MGDSCQAGGCGLKSVGVGVMIIGPLVMVLAGITVSTVALALRRLAWWIPLAAIAAAALLWFFGMAMIDS
ncbi:hypothetical protein [Psychromicrobium lacuslunae]|uniref:hypothetical protein n=1 Tax=Psychromicrobium lacuslunae TaxID=1618207 RepID=UPI0012FE91DD|nr:hypothetical protein [Psychromicrobium lacuslunae]